MLRRIWLITALLLALGPVVVGSNQNGLAQAVDKTSTLVPPRCPGENFTDVCPGDYFYTPVLALNQAGIVSGYNTSPPCETPDHVPCFRPASNVTRAQTSKIISLAANFTEPISGQTFEDIPTGSTFYQYIERLAARDIINGYACGGPGEPCVPPGNRPYFRPNANLTRGQLSKITSESFGYQDVTNIQTFEDVPIGSTFHTYIERLAMREIINGYPCGGPGEPCGPGNRPYFRPGNQVTRAQTAKIVYLAMSQAIPTPTITPTSTSTETPVNTLTPTTPSPTQTATPESTATTITNTPTNVPTDTATNTPTGTATTTPTAAPTGTATNTPSASPTCCTAVTGSISASCQPDPYSVTYRITNSCTVTVTAFIASQFEVSPNASGPWQPLYVGDCFTCPIPPGVTEYTKVVYWDALPAGNNYWRYSKYYHGVGCTWSLVLITDPQPACVINTVTPTTTATATPTETSPARR